MVCCVSVLCIVSSDDLIQIDRVSIMCIVFQEISSDDFFTYDDVLTDFLVPTRQQCRRSFQESFRRAPGGSRRDPRRGSRRGPRRSPRRGSRKGPRNGLRKGLRRGPRRASRWSRRGPRGFPNRRFKPCGAFWKCCQRAPKSQISGLWGSLEGLPEGSQNADFSAEGHLGSVARGLPNRRFEGCGAHWKGFQRAAKSQISGLFGIFSGLPEGSQIADFRAVGHFEEVARGVPGQSKMCKFVVFLQSDAIPRFRLDAKNARVTTKTKNGSKTRA